MPQFVSMMCKWCGTDRHDQCQRHQVSDGVVVHCPCDHTPQEDENNCWAGRKAFFHGQWTTPCQRHGIHLIGTPTSAPIPLCDEHFQQVNAAGLVEEPYIDPAEYERRYQ